MSKQCTRREFVKIAMGAAAVGIMVSLPSVSERKQQGIQCSKCGAIFDQGHRHQEGALSGVYCPNCGVELSRLCYDMDKGLPRKYRRKASNSHKKVALWEWNQVPFPNAGLIRETPKPAIVLSEIRF